MDQVKEFLEARQTLVYFAAIAAAALAACVLPGTLALQVLISPALALMLYVTFLQVPLADFGRAFSNIRFLVALGVSNFAAVPLLLAAMLPFMPAEALLRFGMLLVLLAPCIDYVVTFAHLGKADARLLLVATPGLLLMQMLLLPAYLTVFLGSHAAGLIQPGPFLHAFGWLIVVPLLLAGATQWWAGRRAAARRVYVALGLLPVPATAAVLFVVVASVMPQLGHAVDASLAALPFYMVFAVVAPLIGWFVGRCFGLEATAGRAVAFSTGTRNSLVVLPLALSIPGATPVLPAVIVAQTLVELLGELLYVRWIPGLGVRRAGR
jgi:ACR3 family arsenite efflux pump ArsB